jgi:hypothetical protein
VVDPEVISRGLFRSLSTRISEIVGRLDAWTLAAANDDSGRCGRASARGAVTALWIRWRQAGRISLLQAVSPLCGGDPH